MAVSSAHVKHKHFIESIDNFLFYLFIYLFFWWGGGGGFFVRKLIMITKHINLVSSSRKCAHLFCVPYLLCRYLGKEQVLKKTATISEIKCSTIHFRTKSVIKFMIPVLTRCARKIINPRFQVHELIITSTTTKRQNNWSKKLRLSVLEHSVRTKLSQHWELLDPSEKYRENGRGRAPSTRFFLNTTPTVLQLQRSNI